jgi:acetyl-CoA acetyltransferase
VAVAGGTESMTNVPFLFNEKAKNFFLELNRASFFAKNATACRRSTVTIQPVPALELDLTDPTCGLNMGQTAEVLAKEFGIGR